MKTITHIFRILTIIIFVVFQQAFVITLGLIVYAQSSETAGIIIWCLCLPMIYVNYQTYKFVWKYGFINLITMNADTSEIDVPKGKRWYDA